MMIPFYEELKQSRESLGLSVVQLSNRTKISKEIIYSIEAGDLKILPKTYLRLFIKAYALEVNLDPLVILHHFEEFIGTPEPTSIPSPEVALKEPLQENHEIKENHDVPNIEKKRNRNFATIVIILVIIIFMISVMKQVMLDRKEKSITTAFPDSTQSGLSPVIVPVDTQAVIPQTDLKLTILTKDSCWIKIIVDNRDSFEATLPPRYRKEAVATEQFDVRVGRPAGVNLILNGKDLGPVGAPAIPTRLIITKDGVVRRQSFTAN